ncbi:MAG: ROK family protein [Anaerolineae bacterium]|nr:ROK family protein [Anaerolineae bacterium]
MSHGLLAIDFGGTRTRAAWFSDDLALLHRAESPSLVNRPPQDVINTILATAHSVVPPDATITAIGIAAPGPLDPQQGVIHHALTLPGWKDTPLARLVSDSFSGVPTYLQNDGNLAALAEYHRGAAQGCDPVIYLTISTGIGGGAVIGGKLFTGWRGLAIEPGHMRIKSAGGTSKRLEDVASGTAIGKLARIRLSQSRQASTLRDVPHVNGKAVGEAAVAGDRLALSIIQEASQYLGLGIVNLLHLFNPQAIVIGGSVATLGSLLFDRVTATIRSYVLHPDFWDAQLIRPAQLGDNVCLVGAAFYAATHAG